MDGRDDRHDGGGFPEVFGAERRKGDDRDRLREGGHGDFHEGGEDVLFREGQFLRGNRRRGERIDTLHVVGNDILDKGLVSLDFARQRVYFQPFDLMAVKDEVTETEVKIEPGEGEPDHAGVFLRAYF